MRILLPRVVAVGLAALACAWGVAGVRAGRSWPAGWSDARNGSFGRAVAELRAGAFAGEAFEAKWLEGETLLGMWDALPPPLRAEPEGERLLREAESAYRSAARIAPCSAWPLAGMAGVSARRELRRSASIPFDLSNLGRTSGESLGADGKRAVELWTRAAAAEPHTVGILDARVLGLLDLGLRDRAEAAARSAGAAAPEWEAHESLLARNVPRDLVEAFADGARASVDSTPMLPKQRHWVALGKLERGLGREESAAACFEAALREPATDLHRAEASFHLALARAALGQIDAAERAFSDAARSDTFRFAVLRDRARMRADAGRIDPALDDLAAARRARPDDLPVALDFAGLALRAGELPQAEEAARWATARHPDSVDAWRLLVRIEARSGRSERVLEETLRRMQQATGSPGAVERAREEIAAEPR